MGCMINMYAEFAPIKSMNEYTFPKRRANLSSGIKAIGRSVKVMYGNSSFDAEAIDIDDNAALVVKTADGVKKLNSGEVSIKI